MPVLMPGGRRSGAADLAGAPAAVQAPWEEGAALDAAFVVRCAAEGDQRAWERLAGLYGRLVWAMTQEFGLDESDAGDVAQATWLRLLEHIDRLDHPGRVGSWLAATARNECLRLASRAQADSPGPGRRHRDNGP